MRRRVSLLCSESASFSQSGPLGRKRERTISTARHSAVSIRGTQGKVERVIESRLTSSKVPVACATATRSKRVSGFSSSTRFARTRDLTHDDRVSMSSPVCTSIYITAVASMSSEAKQFGFDRVSLGGEARRWGTRISQRHGGGSQEQRGTDQVNVCDC